MLFAVCQPSRCLQFLHLCTSIFTITWSFSEQVEISYNYFLFDYVLSLLWCVTTVQITPLVSAISMSKLNSSYGRESVACQHCNQSRYSPQSPLATRKRSQNTAIITRKYTAYCSFGLDHHYFDRPQGPPSIQNGEIALNLSELWEWRKVGGAVHRIKKQKATDSYVLATRTSVCPTL